MTDDDIIRRALTVLASRLKTHGIAFSGPSDARTYLTLKLADKNIEHFGVLFLDTQNRLIKDFELSAGTIDQVQVYPREIARAAIACDAAAAVCYHNHPSGTCEPSNADKAMTYELKKALGAIGCNLYDHILVAGKQTLTFAEKGLI